MAKTKGFKNLFITDASGQIARLRKDMRKDYKKAVKKIKKEEEKSDDNEGSLLDVLNKEQQYQQWIQVQQNAAARLAGWRQFVATTGPNAGKIVLPTTGLDPVVAGLLTYSVNCSIAQDVDIGNLAGTTASMALWDILESGSDDHNLGDSLIGQILLFRNIGGALSIGPLIPGLGSPSDVLSLRMLVAVVG